MVLDELTPAQVRRYELWRALNDLATAQEDGRLTPHQAELIRTLAENMELLAGQLHQVVELGQSCVRLLDQLAALSAPDSEG